MKKGTKIFVNIFIILVVLGIVLYFSLKDNFDEIVNIIFKMNIWWFLLGVLGLCMYRSLVGLGSYMMVKANGKHVSLLRCIQINFIILFFHGVTPFAGGGQPMEIYYFHNEKINVGTSTNIVLQNFILYQVALILMGCFAVFYNLKFNLFNDDSLIKRLVLLGFAINILVLIFSCILSFGKKLNKFICSKGLKFLAKIRLVKDADKTRDKLEEYLGNFYKSAKILKSHKLEVLLVVIINVLALCSLYSIPFFVSRGLGSNSLSIIKTIVTTTYTMIIGSFVPIPGGTGGLEYGFMFFFGYLLRGSILTAIMLVWRFISYYMGIIIGAICLMLYRKKDSK